MARRKPTEIAEVYWPYLLELEKRARGLNVRIDGLTPEERRKLQQLLEAEGVGAEESRLAQGIRETLSTETPPHDEADTAVANALKEEATHIGAIRHHFAKLAPMAVERMRNGTYGVCLNPDCETEIRPKRLKAVPYAGLCIHCQERLAAGELDHQYDFLAEPRVQTTHPYLN